ncbi:MAG: hypothetical protein VKI82_11635, partial [Leptolyngbya sp.]|nr:hypothetical protein [Leptolyngbya sp.]
AAPAAAPAAASGTGTVKVEDLLTAMNHLSDGATQYLGKMIVANTWKQSRPDHPWLAQFDIQKDGHFALPGADAAATPDQQQWVRDWVRAFLDRSSRTIRNFKEMVEEEGVLSPQEIALLVGDTA